jgi:2'-5' RNA ligase
MSRIRTFLAVDLAKPVRAAVVDLQEELARGGADLKWTEPENLHVTLIFLGEVEDREVPRVCRIAQDIAAARPSFRLAVEGVGCFPNTRRPRIVWVGLGAGAAELVELHDALEPPLFELGYRREERRYTPHITLGRVKGDGHTDRLTADLAKHSNWQGGEMIVSELCVMSSELAREGPLYTVLGRAKLA